jgi:hypothetical protein
MPAMFSGVAGVVGLELVGNIEDAVARLKKQGVQFHGAASEDNTGKSIYFKDPMAIFCI